MTANVSLVLLLLSTWVLGFSLLQTPLQQEKEPRVGITVSAASFPSTCEGTGCSKPSHPSPEIPFSLRPLFPSASSAQQQSRVRELCPHSCFHKPDLHFGTSGFNDVSPKEIGWEGPRADIHHIQVTTAGRCATHLDALK